jgi:hypothetical protein
MADFLQAKETIREGSKVMAKMADAMDKAADPATAEEGQKEIEEFSAQLKAMDMKAKQAAIKEEAMKYGFKTCFQ